MKFDNTLDLFLLSFCIFIELPWESLLPSMFALLIRQPNQWDASKFWYEAGREKLCGKHFPRQNK